MPEAATEHTVRAVWIDPSWLSWEGDDQGSGELPSDTVTRPYEIHQHACDRLEGSPDEFDRIDAIMTLRRAVARRVKALNEIYRLRELPIGARPKGDLELLSNFGIIRPFMLRRLIDIRNIVEHQDASPPSIDECMMFADLVWYFLRSTDTLVWLKLELVVLVPPGIDRHSRDFRPTIYVNFPETFSEPPEISAWLNPSSFAYEPRADWVQIEPAKIVENKEAEPPRFAVSGKMKGADRQMKILYEKYFNVRRY